MLLHFQIFYSRYDIAYSNKFESFYYSHLFISYFVFLSISFVHFSYSLDVYITKYNQIYIIYENQQTISFADDFTSMLQRSAPSLFFVSFLICYYCCNNWRYSTAIAICPIECIASSIFYAVSHFDEL